MSYPQQSTYQQQDYGQQAQYGYSQPAQDYGATSQYQPGYSPPQQGYAAAPAQQSSIGYGTAAPAANAGYTSQLQQGVAQQWVAASGTHTNPQGAPPPANPGMGEPPLNYPPAPFRKRGASATGGQPARPSSDSFAAAQAYGDSGYLSQPQSSGAVSSDIGTYNQQPPVYMSQPSMAAGSGYGQQQPGYGQQGASPAGAAYANQQQWGTPQQQQSGQWGGSQQQSFAAY